ncbi:MAG: AAA family ATPase [Anaerolineae bacterium]|jgi:cellulose biosynthesis protein BcsQ|nr:AAA family ATPase [Anaerolineae bacterium]
MSTIPTIAFFNGTGGVGETSLVYHLSYMFSELGVRVIAADLDPQANLTAAFLDEDRLLELWHTENDPNTIYQCVQPLIDRSGDIRQPKIQEIEFNLGLLAGDLGLSLFEQLLSDEWAYTLQANLGALRVTSAFWRIMQAAAKEYEAQIILADMGPNLGAINRSILISSDYLITPLMPDLFSLQGLQNLGPTLRHWRSLWKETLHKNAEIEFALPSGDMQPLGYIVIQHGERFDKPVRAYQRWINHIPNAYHEHILDSKPPLETPDSYLIGLVRHYRSLMIMAQEARKPWFFLKPADGATGSHGKLVQFAYQNFKEVALSIAQRIHLEVGEP